MGKALDGVCLDHGRSIGSAAPPNDVIVGVSPEGHGQGITPTRLSVSTAPAPSSGGLWGRINVGINAQVPPHARKRFGAGVYPIRLSVPLSMRTMRPA